MITRFKLIVIALSLSVAGVAACSSSSPKIPDHSQGNKIAYKSTQQDAKSGSDSAAKGDQDADAQASQSTKKAKIPHAEGPIADIDGKPIPAERFNTEMKKIAESGQFPVQLLGQVKGQIIKKIVDKELIDRAVKEAHIKVSDEKLAARIKENPRPIRRGQQEARRQDGLAGRPGRQDGHQQRRVPSVGA